MNESVKEALENLSTLDENVITEEAIQLDPSEKHFQFAKEFFNENPQFRYVLFAWRYLRVPTDVTEIAPEGFETKAEIMRRCQGIVDDHNEYRSDGRTKSKHHFGDFKWWFFERE